MLALALLLLASGVLAAPAASAAAHVASLVATNTPSVTDTATSAPLATDTPTATDTPAPTNTPAPTATATTAPTPTATLPPNPYDLDLRAAASAAAWPQGNSNWCGIATVALIADYVNPGSGVSQEGIAQALNDPANASEWGTPSKIGWGPYLPADIARDFGTDPRSLAEGLTLATGRQYHVIVDTNGAWDTTVHIVRDLLISKQPISVFVDHGQHSVVVSGVVATGNPLTNPKSITYIHVWDPGGGVVKNGNPIGIQPHIDMKIPISLWLSGLTSWSGWYGSDYFKYPYAANIYQGQPLDPDPAVGPYAYQSAKSNHMWIGHYVYISPLGGSATAGLNADWELTPGGALYVGYASAQYKATPDGYSGPTVPMPTNAPPPPPPVRPPTIAPPLPPHPKPKPTATPRPTATATLRPRQTPTADATVDPPLADPPARGCAPARCVLNAVMSGPTPYVLLLLLVLVVGMSLLAPTLAPALFARRRASARAPIEETPTPLLPTPLDEAASQITAAPDDAASAPDSAVPELAAEAPTLPSGADNAAASAAPDSTPATPSQATDAADAADSEPSDPLENSSDSDSDAPPAPGELEEPGEPEASPPA